MAQSQSQRLRRMAEKAARRKVVVAEKRKAEAPLTGVRAIIDAATAPDFACLATEGLFDIGIGWVVAERHLPSGSIGVSIFLVDVWCMGIKDAFFRVTSRRELEEHMSRISGEYPLRPMDPSVARKLLRDAAAYAASFGLPPSENFANVELIFGDTPMAEKTFPFGKDGKPFYMAGPNDSPARQRRILDAVPNTRVQEISSLSTWTTSVDRRARLKGISPPPGAQTPSTSRRARPGTAARDPDRVCRVP